MEKFRSFAELAQCARPGEDFVIEHRKGTTGFAIMAPHGGRIESGTTAVADAIAGSEHAYYTFKGIRPKHNWQLHIPSTCFDEPCALELIRGCHTILTIHGCRRTGKTVYIGGGDTALKTIVFATLAQNGFNADSAPSTALMGVHRNNLCNRGSRGMGLQLEITGSLRRDLIESDSLITSFAQAVRQGLIDTKEQP